jgi:hypothetical protein
MASVSESLARGTHSSSASFRPPPFEFSLMNPDFRYIVPSTRLVVLCAWIGITSVRTSGADSAPAPAPPSSQATVIHSSVPPQSTPNFGHWPVRNGLPGQGQDMSYDSVFALKEIHREWDEIFADDAKALILWPPIPPALAERSASAFRQLPKDFPAGLIELVGETFYMPFGNLSHRRMLSPKRIARIDAYRLSRDRLAGAIRATLEKANGLPSEERQRILLELANEQRGALETLEAEAEAIRQDLTEPGVFRNTDDGAHLVRSVDTLEGRSTGSNAAFVYPLVAAHYHDGFSVEQRMLLQEMAVEQRLATRKSPAVEEPHANPSYIFFVPASARIRLPAQLAPELAGALQRFEEQKEALKTELRAAVESDAFVFLSGRARNNEQLARTQAPAFQALNALAEQIRVDLSRIPYPDAPSKSDLPPELTRRVAAALSEKAELQRQLAGHFKALRDALPKDRVEIVQKGKALAVRVVQSRDVRGNSEQRAKLLADSVVFNRELELRYLALAEEMDALRREIQGPAGGSTIDATRDVDQRTMDFARSYLEQENWKRFTDYYTAVLEPGLSPEQRRLLYKVALVGIHRRK